MIITYDKKTGDFRIFKGDNCVYESVRFVIYCDGHHVGGSMDETAVMAEQNDFGSLNKAFAGPFTFIAYNKIKKSVAIVQHLFGSGTNYYLYQTERAYYLSDSLKSFRRYENFEYKLNDMMLPHYFYNGFLPGTHTLICGIRKLPPGFGMKISKSGAELFSEPYPQLKNDLSEDEAANEYYRIIPEAIDRCIPDREEYSLAISGGYDSNCILHYIKQMNPEVNINAFCVGGTKGVDETAVSRSIAAQYSRVSFQCSFVEKHTRDKLDDIVRRLEGSVYERGIFLQYELAGMLSESGTDHIICGECADQVFNCNLFNKATAKTFFYNYEKNPYDMGAMVILKKNVLMLKSFGINGYYPFLDSAVIEFAGRIAHLNGTTKELHKKLCHSALTDSIGSKISKQGGSTSLSPMFDDGFDIVGEIHRSKFFDPDFMLLKTYNMDEALKDYYLSLVCLESFEKQFCDR